MPSDTKTIIKKKTARRNPSESTERLCFCKERGGGSGENASRIPGLHAGIALKNPLQRRNGKRTCRRSVRGRLTKKQVGKRQKGVGFRPGRFQSPHEKNKSEDIKKASDQGGGEKHPCKPLKGARRKGGLLWGKEDSPGKDHDFCTADQFKKGFSMS